MKRREALTLLVGAGASWPLTARAQQADKMRRIAILIGTADDEDGRARAATIQRALSDLGWSEGRNVRIDIRWIAGDPTKARSAAKELIELAPDVIYAAGTPVVIAAKQLTDAIPIVFVQVFDPVAAGFVKSLAKPNGNVTGFTNFEQSMAGKWLELMKQLSPAVMRCAALFNPDTAPGGGSFFLRALEGFASSLLVEIVAAPVQDATEIKTAIRSLGQRTDRGLIVIPDIFNTAHREPIVSLAAQYRVPTVYPFRQFVAAGGLLSYGIDLDEGIRQAAGYIDRILHGESPSDLPVQAPTKFDLAINLKTAKALGLNVPSTLLSIADEVIE